MCGAPACCLSIHARRLCQKHYVAWRSTATAPDSASRCAARDCDRIRYAKGLCSLHYERARKLDDPGLTRRKTRQGLLAMTRRLSDPDYAAFVRGRKRDRDRHSYLFRQQADTVLAQHGTICHLCGGDIDLDAPRHALAGNGWERGLHLDHVKPLARGGEDELFNIRPAHAWCNLSKGAGGRDTKPFQEALA